MLNQESFFVEPSFCGEARSTGEKLHVRHIWQAAPGREADGVPVLLLHGAIENGHIFYSESGKGLAPFLARNGYDVYVADLRGRGESAPKIARGTTHGQLESICEDIPAYAELIRSRRGDVPQFWMAHSWGGVLMLSTLARFEKYRGLVRALAFFGAKRSIHVSGREKFLKIDLFWNFFARLIAWFWGYLPAREWGLGADNESRLSLSESVAWVKSGPWVDPRDGFNYGTEIKKAGLPPMLFLAGAKDDALGHPEDVRDLIAECGTQEVEFWLLSKLRGNRHDYGHIDMLTHPDAVADHFSDLLLWMSALKR